MVASAIGYFNGDLAPQAAVPDSDLLHTYDEEEEGETNPWDLLASGQFNTEYRKQLEEALAVNSDVNKVRRKLEKVRDMNDNIQEGTHDPSLTKEGTGQQQCEEWWAQNEARLQKIRLNAFIKRNPHLANLPKETLLTRSMSGQTLDAEANEEEEEDVPPVDDVATNLAGMRDCHREVLDLLKDVPLDEEDEVIDARKAAASDVPESDKKDSNHPEEEVQANSGVSDREAETDAPKACEILAEEVGSLLQAVEEVVSESRSAESVDEPAASTAPDGEESEEESTVPESPQIPPKARAPRTERVNEWDRDVYGVDDFDDGMIDDFELMMGSALDDQLSSLRSEILNSKKAETADQGSCELSELD